MRWKTSNENFTRGFQLYYNPLGWLTHAYTYKNDNEVYNFNVEYSYDKMGNMTDFWRGGYISEGSYNHIDMPELTLNGNQMTRVDDYDHVLYYPYNKSFHFVDAASQDNEYTYDQNGNMTQDLNRNISSIQYNLLNLPQNMTYSNNRSTTYVYDATGRKLQVEYVNPATTFDYCGNMIYVNGTLDRILLDDGYIEPYEGEMYYSYYLKDHQGNNRVVAYDNGVVAEVNHYYPFGLLFGESEDPETQKYKYNGKEFDRYHGLDMYDYGARFYDPSICRFTTMDPMCEKYYHLSPYIYCANNPIKYIDVKGEEPGEYFKSKDEAAKDFGIYYNPFSITQKYEFASYIMYNPQNKMYYYPKAISGKNDLVKGYINIIKCHIKTATIHTHGAYDKTLVKNGIDWNDEFSGMENTPQKNKTHLPHNNYDDIYSANKRVLDSYIVTPNGNLKKYDPKTGTISTISKEMPSDINAGNKRVNNIDVKKDNIFSQFINVIMSYLKNN